MITAKEVVQYFMDNGDVGSVMTTPSGKIKAKIYHLSTIYDKDIEEWIYKRIEKYVIIKYIHDNYESGRQLKANQDYYRAITGLIANDQNRYQIHNASMKIPQGVIPELSYDQIIVCIGLTEIVFNTLINIDSYIEILKKEMEEKHNNIVNEILLDLGREEQAWETMQKEIKENGL